MIPASALCGLGGAIAAVSGGFVDLFPDVVSVWPIVEPYVPSPTLQLADLVLGSGTVGELNSGNTPGGDDVYVDPLTGLAVWVFEPPAGGWHWQYDGTTPAPGKIVYGFAAADDSGAGTNLYGVTPPLAVPIVLSGPRLLLLDKAVFTFGPSPLTSVA